MHELRASLLRVRHMVRKELRQLMRDPRTRRVVFVAPIIQLILFGYAVETDVRNVDTVLLDRDRTQASRMLADAFTASGYFRIAEVAESDHDITRALDGGRARVALVIPSGFAADLAAGRGTAVQVLLDGTSSNTATVAQGYAARLVREFGLEAVRGGAGAAAGGPRAAGGGPRAAAGGESPRAGAASGGIDLRVRAWFNPGLVSRVYNVPAVIGVIVLLMSLLLTAMAVVRERETGTLDQLLVSPLTAGELVAGKTLPVALVAMIQLALVSAVALLWFDIPFTGSLAALVVASALFILAGLSFGLLLSTISRTQQEAFLSMFLFFLPAIILSGFLYPIETMPAFFQWIAMLNPLRHFLDVVRDLFLKGAGFADLWQGLSILAVMAAGGLALATRRFRASLE